MRLASSSTGEGRISDTFRTILAGAITNHLPPWVRDGWMLIARNMVTGCNAREAEEVAAWITMHGQEVGFRAPHTRERGRAMGMGSYLAELGVNEQELYDAQGNSFDPQAVALRLRDGIHEWAAGGLLSRHPYPDLATVTAAFEEDRHYVENRGLLGCARPFPHDLHDRLLCIGGTPQLSATPAASSSPAAEHGRGE